MTVRSVVVSLFIIFLSLGMTATNTIDTRWQGDHNNQSLYGYQDTRAIVTNNMPNINSYPSVVDNITTYNKPADVSFNLDFFQNIKYGSMIMGLLFNPVTGFFLYLNQAGLMELEIATPLTIALVLNHIIALIYIVTGRTFIY